VCQILPTRQKTDQLCNGGVEHIEPVHCTRDLGQQSRLHISYCHHPILNPSIIPELIKLTDAEDVCLELGDEVDASEDSVFSALAPENDCITPFDAHHRAISEPHHAADPSVEIGEGTAGTAHVIGSPGVDDSLRLLQRLPFRTDLRKHLLLHQVNRSAPHGRRHHLVCIAPPHRRRRHWNCSGTPHGRHRFQGQLSGKSVDLAHLCQQ
jgi:hypothetical protein